MSEVRLIDDWREKWEPVTKYRMDVIAVLDTPNGLRCILSNGVAVWIETGKEHLIPKPRPKTFRPWTREEVPVGSVVRHIRDNTIHMILCYEKNDSVWIAGAGNRPTTYLLDSFVMHLTNPDGSWVPTEQCPKCGVEE